MGIMSTWSTPKKPLRHCYIAKTTTTTTKSLKISLLGDDMCNMGWLPQRNSTMATSLLGARTLLGAPGLTTRSKDATRNKGHRY